MSTAVLIAHIDAGKQAKKYDYVADRGMSPFYYNYIPNSHSV